MVLLGFKEVELKDITVSSKNVRKEIPDEGISELAENIGEIGLIHPIIVDKDMGIICGQRRFRALQHLGLEKTWVKVVDVEDTTATAMSLAEHFQRIDPTDKDITESVVNLYEKVNSVRKVATMTGTSHQTIMDIVRRVSKEFKDKLDKSDLTESKKRVISRVGDDATPEQQDHLIQFSKDATYPQTKEIVKKIQQKLPVDIKKEAEKVAKEKYFVVPVSIPASLYNVMNNLATTKRKLIQDIIIETLKKVFNK